ncbi:MAG: nucleotidyltransferase family protein [Xanthomonadaceae bacterium]|nr:nucleotidyltransferase family protein [Xanthomonadaceae bacterium]
MLKEIETHREQIAELCRRYGVKRLELFGSAARGRDFQPGHSDIDFLVDFNADEPPTLEHFLDLESRLSDLLGRPVDVISRSAVERSRNYIRRRSILRDAQAVYG